MFRCNHHHQGEHYSCLRSLMMVIAPKDVGAVLMSILM
jgi:hypothetical protein